MQKLRTPDKKLRKHGEYIIYKNFIEQNLDRL